jgi:hypothetical protein
MSGMKDTEDYVELLRETMHSISQSNRSKRTKYEVMAREFVKILETVLISYNSIDVDSLVKGFDELLDEWNDFESEGLFFDSLISLHRHRTNIAHLFSQEKFLERFSKFLSQNLSHLYALYEKDNLATFLNIVENPKIAEGIAFFIGNKEHAPWDIYEYLWFTKDTPYLLGDEKISEAFLKQTDVLVDMVKSEEMNEEGREYWCWDVISFINHFPLLMQSEQIQEAISEQVQFISGCIMFGPPADYPIAWIIDQILDVRLLLSFTDIQVALSMCLQFADTSESIDSSIVTKMGSSTEILRHPILREVLRGVVKRWRFDLVLPSEYNREFTSDEVKIITKIIEETKYPLAAVMSSYFIEKAWQHESVKTKAISRLDDIAEELESHHSKYEFWNYHGIYFYSWFICQIDILFDHKGIISALKENRRKLKRNLGEFYEDLPNKALDKALSAIGMFWSEYDGKFHDVSWDDEDTILCSDSYNISLYDLVKLWLNTSHPWTPKEFLNILEQMLGSFNKEDPLWNFCAVLESVEYHFIWSQQRRIQNSEAEQRKIVAGQLSEFEDDFKSIRIPGSLLHHYNNSLRHIGPGVSDSSDEFESYTPR